MSEFYEGIQTIFSKLSVKNVRHIEQTNDPFCLGYKDEIVFIHPRVVQDKVNLKIEFYKKRKKSFFLHTVDWTEKRSGRIILENKNENEEHIFDDIRNAIMLTTTSFQQKVGQSGEPITFTYRDRENDLQVEVIYWADKDNIEWSVHS